LMAEHANNAKTQFLRAMSHELRTPLNAISGYTEILEMGIRGVVNPAQVKDLGRIKRASAYLLRLINDVLTIARLEGARPLHLISIEVNPVLSEVEGLCILQAKANALELTVTECEHEIFATADAERFQQILLNLVTNAIKFTPKGGSISVACDDESPRQRHGRGRSFAGHRAGIRAVCSGRPPPDDGHAAGRRTRSVHQQGAGPRDEGRSDSRKRGGSWIDVYADTSNRVGHLCSAAD
jgi:light-regulated signal transduction histidine kinase (bacteriophytochrome)